MNFDNTVHRREALWQSELAIQPMGSLFDVPQSSRLSRIAVRRSSASPADAPLSSAAMPPFSQIGGIAADSTGTTTEKHSFSANRAAEPQEKSSTPFIKRMEGLELIEADLRKTGISIGKHPMALIRDEMKKKSILTAHESKYLKRGQVVSVAGAVIIRQRPMTAKNVVFITLEDETGHSNFVVMPDKFEEYRSVINQNDYLIIRGIFEERGMLKAIHFDSINRFSAEVVSHNFR